MTRPHGTVRVAAGTTNEGLVDGPAAEAWFAQPSGLAATDERLWIADSEIVVPALHRSRRPRRTPCTPPSVRASSTSGTATGTPGRPCSSTRWG